MLVKFSESYKNSILYISILVVSLCSLYDLLCYDLRTEHPIYVVVRYLLMSVLKSSILYGLIVQSWSKIIKCCAISYFGVFSILSLVNYVGTLIFDCGVNRRLITIISQTNAEEFVDFMKSLFSMLTGALYTIKSLFFLVLLIVIEIVLVNITKKTRVVLLLILSAAGLGCYVHFMYTARTGRTASIMGARIVASVKDVVISEKEKIALMNNRRPLAYAETILCEKKINNIVVVIGESSSPFHWHLYGYGLPTTPILDSYADSLMVFQHAYTSASSTDESLKRALTLMEDSDWESDWYDHASLVDIVNAAGYETYYYSNQESGGAFSGCNVATVSNANHIKYVGAEYVNDHADERFDSILLAKMEEAMNDSVTSKMIILHTLGSHQDYNRRTPVQYKKFSVDDAKKVTPLQKDESKLQTIAHYDNSVLYTDYILSEVIRHLAQRHEDYLLIYFSDHGEIVYDYSLDKISHDNVRANVPFICYANKSLRTSGKDLVQSIKESEKTAISTADLPHFIMGCTGISYAGYEPQKDFLNIPNYQQKNHYFDGQIIKDYGSSSSGMLF